MPRSKSKSRSRSRSKSPKSSKGKKNKGYYAAQDVVWKGKGPYNPRIALDELNYLARNKLPVNDRYLSRLHRMNQQVTPLLLPSCPSNMPNKHSRPPQSAIDDFGAVVRIPKGMFCGPPRSAVDDSDSLIQPENDVNMNDLQRQIKELSDELKGDEKQMGERKELQAKRVEASEKQREAYAKQKEEKEKSRKSEHIRRIAAIYSKAGYSRPEATKHAENLYAVSARCISGRADDKEGCEAMVDDTVQPPKTYYVPHDLNVEYPDPLTSELQKWYKGFYSTAEQERKSEMMTRLQRLAPAK